MAHSLYAHASAPRVPTQASDELHVPAEASETAGGESVAAAAPSWGLILGVGGLCWLLGTVLALLRPAAGGPLPAAAQLLQYLVAFLAASGAYRTLLALRWPQGRARAFGLGLLHGALALAVLGIAALVPAFTAAVLPLPAPVLQWTYAIEALQGLLPIYVLGLCAVALSVSERRRGEEARRAAELAQNCATARMSMLSAQLQPHFLFNALHAISVLVDVSPRRASAMIARLGDFLRHALESSRWAWTDLASELAGVEAYLAVQQMRFGAGLSVAVDASPHSLDACVPALLLQPLAENAIEHGRRDTAVVLQVRISAAVIAGRLFIKVSNSGAPLPRELSAADFGHGLLNVEQRLRAAYDDDAQLTVGPDGSGGTAAFLDLPRREFWPARSAQRSAP